MTAYHPAQSSPSRFDALSHAPVDDGTASMSDSEALTLRIWDAWADERPWDRDLADVARAHGIPKGGAERLYRGMMHGRRGELLDAAADAYGTGGGAAGLLLRRIAVAAPLL